MTDPVTNVEIEDVLSSIRRLVSEKGRADAPVDAAPKPVAPTEALVLTPALRVADPLPVADEARAEEVFEAEAADPIAESEEMVADLARSDFDGLAEDVEIEVETAPVLETVEPEAGEPEILAELQETPEVDFVSEAELPEPELVSGVAPGALSADLESRIAKWEAVVATSDENYEPARAGEDDYAGTEVESLPWQDHSDPVTEYQGDIRRHEPEIVDVEDQVEDLVEEPADDPVEEPQALRAEDVVVEAVADDVTEQVQAGVDETLLDEEALRELVGEIVRQELQGALGERITRNVRKLVRREIHRALSASGLD